MEIVPVTFFDFLHSASKPPAELPCTEQFSGGTILHIAKRFQRFKAKLTSFLLAGNTDVASEMNPGSNLRAYHRG